MLIYYMGDSMKMLVTDFDLTLFNGNDYDKNIKYINKFMSVGNIFVIATGRNIKQLGRDFKYTEENYNYLICNDGGIIFDKNGDILYRCDIPNRITPGIADIFMNNKYVDDWYIDTGFDVNKNITDQANGIIGHFTNRDEAVKILNQITDTYTEIYGYISEQWINITAKSVNKGNGIKILSDMISFKEENIYTIGDNHNDITMCNYNFNTASMANGVDELKSKCKKQYKAVYELVEDIIKEE